MTYRWFIWGLANGVFVLAIAGGFWFGLAASNLKPSPLFGLISVIEIAVLWAGFRLRRKSAGFRISEVREGNGEQRHLLRQIAAGFWRIAVAEAVLATAAVGVCVALNRKDLMWPALGLAVSLHFAPLGYIFRLRPYYVLAALGASASIIAAVGFTGTNRTIFLGTALGTIVWLTAAYAFFRAEQLSQRALHVFATRASA